MIVTTTFQRKTFCVKAIRVTVTNMEELAEWCGGVVKIEPSGSGEFKAFVEIASNRVPRRRGEIRAYMGDWITCLSEGNNFKVYKNKTFLEAFEEIRSVMDKYAAVLQIVRDINRADRVGATDFDGEYLDSEDIANQIVSLFERAA